MSSDESVPVKGRGIRSSTVRHCVNRRQSQRRERAQDGK